MELTAQDRRLSLGAVMLHMLGIGLTLGLTFPLTSLTLEAWGSAAWVVGLAGAMAPLAILLFMPVLPSVAQKLGAVRAMILGCGIGIAGLVVMYLVQTAPVWVAMRFVIGAGLALPWLAGDIWVNAVAQEESRGRVIAGYVACLFIGFSAGPLLLDYTGITGIAPFAMGCGALALAVLPLIAVGRLAPTIVAEQGSGVLSAARAVPVMAVGAFVAGFTEALIFSLLTLWGLETGLDETGALRLLTTCIIGGVVLQFAVGIMADRIGRQRLLGLIGLALIAIGALLQLSTGGLVFVAAFITGGLILALYGLSLILLGERFSPAQLAAASAAFLILYQLGSVTGPLVAGAAMDLGGAVGFVFSLSGAGLAIALVAFTTRTRTEEI
ncbi:putative MFS-type transporter YcaD [Roseovarius mucosus]|uniref:Putative MFS-type transporter YcaD n=1 Tax=Roseovarius mucosus TaxID=215743 RepID=A0A1V0RUB7_9RHOB|nr:MFS transporter [Roseovarius mucosus]ARE85363.1 putative MFS-type transporter YcaD [Roseovarius mucosus]